MWRNSSSTPSPSISRTTSMGRVQQSNQHQGFILTVKHSGGSIMVGLLCYYCATCIEWVKRAAINVLKIRRGWWCKWTMTQCTPVNQRQSHQEQPETWDPEGWGRQCFICQPCTEWLLNTECICPSTSLIRFSVGQRVYNCSDPSIFDE